jgi:hypothetical protein
MITLFFLITLNLHLLAPEFPTLPVERPTPISFYDRLIKAIVMIESSGGKQLYNKKEGAVGAFQIRQIRLDHYNQQNATFYKLSDCFDYQLSKKVFLYYAHGKSYEKAAKTWNGSGSATIVYWNKVKNQLNKN